MVADVSMAQMIGRTDARFDALDQELRAALDDLRSLRTWRLALYGSVVAAVVVVALMILFFLTEHG